MTNGLVVLACAALALVAASGVIRPLTGRVRPAPAAREAHHSPHDAGGARARPRRAALPISIAALALAAFSLPFLLDGHRPSPTEATPSAIQGTAALRQRAVRDPQDPTARLELASAYLQSGDVPAATRAYVDVLRVDPSNPEAHTQLGWILLGAGRPTEALVEENRALSARPAYPEALYVRGLVLLRGLHRPPRAADSFRDYLAAAPFGSHRSQVLALLRSIRARAGAGGA